MKILHFINVKIKWIMLFIGFVIAFSVGVLFYLNSQKIWFFPYKISEYSTQVSCELTHASNIYNMSTNVNKDNTIKVDNYEKQKSPLKYTFKNLGQEKVKIILGDSLGVDETQALKVSEDSDMIHLVGVWGMTNQGITTYTIYKNTGFFTYTRSGSMLLLGESLMTGFGRCF